MHVRPVKTFGLFAFLPPKAAIAVSRFFGAAASEPTLVADDEELLKSTAKREAAAAFKRAEKASKVEEKYTTLKEQASEKKMTYEAHLSRRRESREEDEALECAWECAFYATSKYELYADKTAKAAFEARASHEAHGKAARAVITSVSEMNTRAIEAYGEKAERDPESLARDAYLELLQENKAYKSEFDKVVTEKIYSLLTAVIQPALKATMENKDVVCLLKTFDLHRLILNYFMSVRRNARAIQDRDKTTREPKFVEKYVRAEAQMKLACNRLCELSISLVEKHSVAAVTRALIGVHTKEVVREIEGELKNFHDKYKVSTAATVASSDLKVENMSDDEL